MPITHRNISGLTVTGEEDGRCLVGKDKKLIVVHAGRAECCVSWGRSFKSKRNSVDCHDQWLTTITYQYTT